jgi:hypothetical protein
VGLLLTLWIMVGLPMLILMTIWNGVPLPYGIPFANGPWAVLGFAANIGFVYVLPLWLFLKVQTQRRTQQAKAGLSYGAEPRQ